MAWINSGETQQGKTVALINCPECQTEISDKATACPKCGNPLTPAVSPSIDSGLGESQLMEKYGISFNGDQYDCQGYRYSRFDDALTFAKSQVEKPNPEHIANLPPPKEKSSGMWWKVLLTIFGIFVALILFGKHEGDKPENAGKYSARSAIELCWSEQSRKSLDPSSQRFIAGACEKMESDFKQRYGVSP